MKLSSVPTASAFLLGLLACFAAACAPASKPDADEDPDGSAPARIDTGAPGGGGRGGGGAGGRIGADAAAGGTGGGVADAAAPAADGPSVTPGVDAAPQDVGAAPDTASPKADGGPVLLPGSLPFDKVKSAKAELVTDIGTKPEGAGWRNDGSVFGCSNGMFKVDATGKRFRYQGLTCVGTYALPDGSVMVAGENQGIFRLYPDETYVSLAKPPSTNANDLSLDAEGNIYFTDIIADKVWRLTPEGALDTLLSGLKDPNGLEVDPESKHLYVNMAGAGEIWRYDLTPGGKSLTNGQSIIGGLSAPDGCTFDGWGNLWVAQFSASDIVVVDVRNKSRIGSFGNGAGGTTSNLAFGGPNNDVLYVTGGNGITRIAVGVRGATRFPGAAQYKELGARMQAKLVPF